MDDVRDDLKIVYSQTELDAAIAAGEEVVLGQGNIFNATGGTVHVGGNGVVEASGRVTVIATGTSTVYVQGNAVVRLANRARAIVYGKGTIYAFQQSCVYLLGHGATAELYHDAMCYMVDDNLVEAYDNSYVNAELGGVSAAGHAMIRMSSAVAAKMRKGNVAMIDQGDKREIQHPEPSRVLRHLIVGSTGGSFCKRYNINAGEVDYVVQDLDNKVAEFVRNHPDNFRLRLYHTEHMLAVDSTMDMQEGCFDRASLACHLAGDASKLLCQIYGVLGAARRIYAVSEPDKPMPVFHRGMDERATLTDIAERETRKKASKEIESDFAKQTKAQGVVGAAFDLFIKTAAVQIQDDTLTKLRNAVRSFYRQRLSDDTTVSRFNEAQLDLLVNVAIRAHLLGPWDTVAERPDPVSAVFPAFCGTAVRMQIEKMRSLLSSHLSGQFEVELGSNVIYFTTGPKKHDIPYMVNVSDLVPTPWLKSLAAACLYSSLKHPQWLPMPVASGPRAWSAVVNNLFS